MPGDPTSPPIDAQPDAFTVQLGRQHGAPHEHAYSWRAVYRDGTVLDEMDEHGTDVHGFRDVDQERLAAFALLPLSPGLPPVTVLIDAPGGQRPIFFRRRTALLNPTTGAVTRAPAANDLHVIGWQRTIGEPPDATNVRSVVFVLPDGRLVLSDNPETHFS